ncbi:MAG: TetR/AcrR family transcriptional regulator [Parasphingorhabdus sp.]
MSKREEILDIAERGYRTGGFSGISYRDIAAELGIKSASIHYHFPHKEDLGKAVVERYADNFIDSLGAPDSNNDVISDRVTRLANAYRNAFADAKASCLCAVLGSVSPQLPSKVQKAVRVFFDRLLDWTQKATEKPSPELIAMLQGAMILSVATDDPNHLDQVISKIREEY